MPNWTHSEKLLSQGGGGTVAATHNEASQRLLFESNALTCEPLKPTETAVTRLLSLDGFKIQESNHYSMVAALEASPIYDSVILAASTVHRKL